MVVDTGWRIARLKVSFFLLTLEWSMEIEMSVWTALFGGLGLGLISFFVAWFLDFGAGTFVRLLGEVAVLVVGAWLLGEFAEVSWDFNHMMWYVGWFMFASWVGTGYLAERLRG